MNKKTSTLSINYYIGLSICLSALAILGGGAIYILFRISEPVFFSWIRLAGLGKWLDIVRQYSFSYNLHLPTWIVYSLPNGLWAFAYALLITNIWADSKSRLRYFWLASIPLLILGFEGLQYLSIISGTFCVEDMILGTIGLVSGIIIGFKIPKLLRYEKQY